jgi:hypothetical protein
VGGKENVGAEREGRQEEGQQNDGAKSGGRRPEPHWPLHGERAARCHGGILRRPSTAVNPDPVLAWRDLEELGGTASERQAIGRPSKGGVKNATGAIKSS